jgi:ArsR family transcriptional regulator
VPTLSTISCTDSSAVIAHESDIQRAAFALKAMSHPLRLKILCAVGEQELSVQDIVDSVGTSQSNVSQHLAKLRDKDILASRRDANRIFYRVNDERTLRLIEMMREVFCSSKADF